MAFKDLFTNQAHTVLGKNYKSSGFGKRQKGKKQLRNLVKDLCSSEHCRNFIAWKLCRHFICDNPKPEMIKIVTDAWINSKGMLPDIHKAVLMRLGNMAKMKKNFYRLKLGLFKLQE